MILLLSIEAICFSKHAYQSQILSIFSGRSGVPSKKDPLYYAHLQYQRAIVAALNLIWSLLNPNSTFSHFLIDGLILMMAFYS